MKDSGAGPEKSGGTQLPLPSSSVRRTEVPSEGCAPASPQSLLGSILLPAYWHLSSERLRPSPPSGGTPLPHTIGCPKAGGSSGALLQVPNHCWDHHHSRPNATSAKIPAVPKRLVHKTPAKKPGPKGTIRDDPNRRGSRGGSPWLCELSMEIIEWQIQW